MRKVYTFLASALLTVLGATSLQAQQYYDVNGFPDAKLTEVTPGQNIVLQPASQGASPKYFNGTASSTKVTPDCIYTFELAPEQIDGGTTYVLKQVSTGKYLEDVDYTENAVKFVESKAKAQPLFVKPAQFYYGAGAIPKEADWTTTAIYDSAHYNKVIPENAFVVSLANHEKHYFNSMWGNAAFYSVYQDTNTWQFYEATQMTGKKRLEAMLGQLFPNGGIDKYTVGEDVGQVPQAAVDALQKAYDEANDALESDDATANQVADNLWNAYQNYEKAVIGLHTGYFYIRDGRVNEKNYVYDKNGVLSFVENYDLPEEVTPLSAAYVWYVTEKDGKFIFQNFATKQYATSTLLAGTNPKHFACGTEAQSALWEVVANAKFPGTYNIQLSHGKGMWNTDRGAKGICEWNDYNDPGSVWRFTPVKESALEKVKEAMKEALAKKEQNTRNNKMGVLVRQAEEAINTNYAYKADVENINSDGYVTFENPGLIEDVAQITGNANEKTEGPIESLTDNKAKTFYHSTWHASDSVKVPHFLQFELTEPVQTAEFQILKRFNATGELKEIQIYATNDTLGTWENQGYYAVNFNRNALMPNADNPAQTDTLKNYAAIVGFQLNKPYSFLRLVAVRNASNGTTLGQAWMHMAELRIYQATLDEATSVNSAIAPAILNGVKTALSEGSAALADSTVTDQQIEALTKALKEYNDATPQPQKITDRVALLEQILANTQEGTELGYFQAGAKDAFKAVIDEVKAAIQPVMSVDDVNAQIAKLEAALKAFNEKLNVPAADKYYRIQCATTDTNSKDYQKYLFAQNSGATRVALGGRKDDGSVVENLKNRLNFYWKLVKNEDGTYSFMNAATGTYIGNTQKKDSNPISMRLQNDSISFNFGSSKAGTFNIVLDQTGYLHADPQTNIVRWWDPNASTSCYTFVEAGDEWAAEQASDINASSPRIVTLPYAVQSDFEHGKAYMPLGVKDKKLQLKAYTEDIPAGMPFILVPEKEQNVVTMYLNASTLGDIQYVKTASEYKAAATNGSKETTLKGTLLNDTVRAGQYYLNGAGTMILKTEKDGMSGYNGGWFTALSETAEAGDITIKVDPDLLEDITTGIVGVEVVNNTNNKIYDLQGRQVKKAVKGVYIINGKKVVK